MTSGISVFLYFSILVQSFFILQAAEGVVRLLRAWLRDGGRGGDPETPSVLGHQGHTGRNLYRGRRVYRSHRCVTPFFYIFQACIYLLDYFSGITNAYAKGAKLKGAQVVEHCPVEKILVENKKVVGVQTKRGTVG